MVRIQRITPCLWFDDQAETAARFYVSLFPNSRIQHVARYPKSGTEIHGRKPGSVMTVSFEIDGQPFTALNGGPIFQFNESISFVVSCANQREVNHYWKKLSAGGDPRARQCGWLKDKFGVSWQVVPTILHSLIGDPDRTKAERTFAAMLRMKKLDIAALQRAHAG